MTSDRPHHAALEPADALAQLKRGAGSQFDPKVVEAFHAEFAGETGPSSASRDSDVDRRAERRRLGIDNLSRRRF